MVQEVSGLYSTHPARAPCWEFVSTLSVVFLWLFLCTDGHSKLLSTPCLLKETAFAQDRSDHGCRCATPVLHCFHYFLRTDVRTHSLERVDQLDPIRVDDAEHRRGGQEALRPVLMGHKEAKEPRPRGEPREQRPIVARQPAIEWSVAPAFEGMEQPQGDHFTGPEVGRGGFGDRAQLLIDLVE